MTPLDDPLWPREIRRRPETEETRRRGPLEPGTSRRMRTIAVRILAAALVAALLPSPPAARAQQPPPGPGAVRWFPDTTAFAPLLAAPRETGLRGSFVLSDRPDLDGPVAPVQPPGAPPAPSDFEGTNIEAEVALGLRVPVVLLRRETGSGPSVAVEFETGVFTRFFLETSEKDLINADFRVGAPVSLGYRGFEARLELRHLSSHFGDDFVRRFDPPFRQVSQEGFELLLARRFARAVRLYGGGEWNFNLSEEVVAERGAARWGLEYDPGAADGRRKVWPFAAADFRIESLTDEVAGTGTAGVAFRVGGVGLRLETRGHFGPSPMGQLRRFDETFWGLGLRIAPTAAFF